MDSSKISEFAQITGATADEAQFYLESHNGQLDAAIASYYENPQGSTEPATASVPTATAAPAATSSQAKPPAAANVFASSSNSRIKTFGQLRGDFSQNDDEGDSDDEQQTFFTGGEKSGMLVQGPGKKRAPNELIEAIMKQAAEGGKEMQEEDEASSSSKKPAQSFTGAGFTLGSDAVPSRPIGQPQKPEEEQGDEAVERELTFWRNGFSIGDGPLMQYNDPAHQKVLADIQSGRAPPALFGLKFGQRANVRVAHRMQDDYVPPKPTVKPFEGQGHRLGSHVPYEAPAATSAPAPTAPKLEVDAAKPVTSIQLRLADGTRMLAKFNTTHTVADLRRFVQNCRPNQAGFVLQTPFPVKTLDDDKLTLEQAGLLNSVVVQKFV